MQTPLEWAIHYLTHHHWSVIPVGADKKPLIDWTTFQSKRATKDQVHSWYSKWPTAGVGVVTGKLSGLVVLDVDAGAGGHETLAKLTAKGVFTKTQLAAPRVLTQSGGLHFYFLHPGGHVPNAVGLWPGVDLRGDGGQVVAPPTQGVNGMYEWRPDAGCCDLPFTSAPDELLKVTKKTDGAKGLSKPELSAILKPQHEGGRIEAMKKLVGHLAGIGEGKAASKAFVTFWNEKNLPPLDPAELDYQFEEMWKKWGAPKPSATLDEQLAALDELPMDEAKDKLLHVLHGKQLASLDFIHYQELVKAKWGLSKKNFTALVKPAKYEVDGHGAEPNAVEVPPERMAEALKLLKHPGLLHIVLRMAKCKGLVGEEANILLNYLAATSRLLDDPINVLCTGESASGKSVVARGALSLIPPEHVIERQGFSAQAILYSDLDFRHKIVLILEYEGQEKANFNIRTFISEKRIIFEVTIRGEDGKFHTQLATRDGPTGFITTTVLPSIEHQTETRYWTLRFDDSAEQTKRILAAQRKMWEVPADAHQPFHDAQRLLGNAPVAKPEHLLEVVDDLLFENLKRFPPRLRRDHVRLIEAVRTSAKLHQYQRERDANGTIIPDLRDYAIVWRLIRSAFSISLAPETKPAVQEVVKATAALFLEGQMEPVQRGKMQDVFIVQGWSPDKFKHALDEAVHLQLLSQAKYGHYVPSESVIAGSDVVGNPDMLPSPAQLIQRDQDLGGHQVVDPLTGEPEQFG